MALLSGSGLAAVEAAQLLEAGSTCDPSGARGQRCCVQVIPWNGKWLLDFEQCSL